MSIHGKTIAGKQERRKEIAQIAMMHPRTYVAQTTCAHTNHFYKAVLGALEFDGPAIVVLLHDLPAGARRGRQHGRRAGAAGRRHAGVPAA